MRVCLIGPVWPYRGGIAHNSAIIAQSVISSGNEISILSFQRQYPKWLYPGQTDRDNSSFPLKTKAEYVLDPFSPISWKKTADIALSRQPDLVLLQWWTFFWGIPFAYITRYIDSRGVRIAYSIHNVTSHERYALDRFFTRISLSPAKFFLVYSESEKQKLLQLFPKKHLVLTKLPIYAFTGSENLQKKTARKSLNVPLSEIVLLFFGFIRPYKGLDLLLEALSKLRGKGITPYLAIVGEFWSDKRLYQDMIIRYDLQNQIRIEDRYVPNEEADLWFRAADVLIAPYTKGVTQSAVASLALGYGIPMIVTKQVAEGLQGSIDEGIYTIPPDDAEALALEILNFIKNNKMNDENIPVTSCDDQLMQALSELASYSTCK